MAIFEKKRKKRGTNSDENGDPWKATPEELEVAKYLIRKLPSREGKLSGMIVQIFIAVEAVELLMASPWAKVTPIISDSKNTKPSLFTTQASAETFMATLLQKRIFHRAMRAKKKTSSKPRDDKSMKTKSKKILDQNKNGSDVSKPTSSDIMDQTVMPVKSQVQTTSSSKTSSPSSSKKPIRIEMADEQIFVIDDPQSVYVWIYEPPPGLFNWLAGLCLIIAIILCCLFPIWPSELRLVAYYATIAISASVGVLIFLALVRLCLFIVVWVLTLGRYNLWLFPNYFEDCGFLASFKPVYSLCEARSVCNKDSIQDTVKPKKIKPKLLTSSLPQPDSGSETTMTKVEKQD